MLTVILSLIYILIITYGVGLLISKGLAKIGALDLKFSSIVVAGIVTITVGVEYISIVGKIGILAHVLLILVASFGYFSSRKVIPYVLDDVKKVIFSWEGFFYLGFVLLIAFYASRGMFHTDTNIYHAQNIRIYEEYGLIRGMGNLQLHYGYNSAYLAFASIFSMGWLFGEHPLHTTTAFLEVFAGIYSFYGLKRFKNHNTHIGDAAKVAILFYILIIITGSMSPATDYGTMLISLLLISLWCDEMEGQRRTYVYGLLAVFAVFAVTMKFSACLLVAIAIYPAILLIKSKDIKGIIVFLSLGIVVLVPFLIRNYLISGWLLYPADFIDIFNVAWKVPKEYLEVDTAQIKVWGRCLYDVSLLDMSVKEWFPIWFEQQDRYEMMLILGILAGGAFSSVYSLRYLLQKKCFRFEFITVLIAIIANIVVWFLTAPFIRYGLAFILPIIFLPLGCFVSEEKRGLFAIVSGMMTFACIACLTPYFDNYIKDAGTTMKQTVAEPYYFIQKPYDDAKTGKVELNGNTIYYCDEGEINSYLYCPNTCYQFMLERSELMGEEIEDGFQPK